MNSKQPYKSESDLPVPPLPTLPCLHSPTTPNSTSNRRVAIAVDLSDESAYAVKWAVENYLRPGDAVILLHVRPTSVLYGADWGSIQLQINNNNTPFELSGSNSPDNRERQKLEDDFDSFTNNKANLLAKPLLEADVPFKIHIVKDHDMKERLCLEVERLGLSAVIMGSRGFGATRKMGGGKGGIVGGGRLGSVSDYCVQHCVCPVVVVRCNDDGKEGESVKIGGLGEEIEEGLHPVPEEDQEECVDDELKGLYFGTFCVIFRYEMMSFLFCDVGFVFVWGNFGLGDWFG
jgi:nucleotide-binding universal stress UspA family protein